jgi:surfeit locus 1 family protein
MGRLLFLIIVGLAGAGILIGLGIWQVQRLAWKEGVLAQIETRIASDPVALPLTPDPEADRYMPVRLTGTIAPAELHVLVSIKRVGPGYRVISPFTTEGGRRLLLDRGFIPDAAKGAARAGGTATVTGNLHWPRETDGFTPAPDIAGNIWFARDVPAMAAALGTEEILVVASALAPPDPDVRPMPVDTAGIPNDHLEYAITWFSLAAIWIGMSLYFVLRGRRTPERDLP